MTVVVRKGGLGKGAGLSDREWNLFLKVGLSVPEESLTWITDMTLDTHG